jgi:tRNA-guanine family transglycosylase
VSSRGRPPSPRMLHGDQEPVQRILVEAEELLGMQLLTQHNIAVMNRLMREVQVAISEGRLDELRKRWVAD